MFLEGKGCSFDSYVNKFIVCSEGRLEIKIDFLFTVLRVITRRLEPVL